MKKNRLFYLIVVLLIPLFIFGCGSGEKKKSYVKEKKTEVKEPIKTPNVNESPKVSETPKESEKPMVKKIIVIDSGHGKGSNLEKERVSPSSSETKIKDGGGATGIVTKMPEYVFNFKISLKLKKLLEEKGFVVIMTKEDVNKSLGNIERADIGNNAKANLVIRIHADSLDNKSVEGASMLIPAPGSNTKEICSESKRCGSIVLDSLIKKVGMKNRGLSERSDMTGFNWSKVPVILVEAGFLSNEKEDKLLSSYDYDNKIAEGLSEGIENCFK